MNRKYRDADFLSHQYVQKRCSANEIAEQCGVSSSTVRRWLNRHDIERQPPYRDREWLYEQYVDKCRNQTEIAVECGVAETTICHWFGRLGITDGESLQAADCRTCGRTFRYYPSVRDGEFCSNACANSQRKRQVEVVCPNCDTAFERRQSLDTRYCSMQCWGEDTSIDTDSPYRGIWHEQRQQALERDGYQCTVCGISNQEHAERFGHGLDVHHLVPVRLFVRWERPVSDAHTLRNLRTVCRTHHPDAPGTTVESEATNEHPPDDT